MSHSPYGPKGIAELPVEDVVLPHHAGRGAGSGPACCREQQGGAVRPVGQHGLLAAGGCLLSGVTGWVSTL